MRVLGGVMNKSIRNIEKKYRISCCGTGLSMPGGPIRSIGFSFQVKGPLSKSELRRMTVGSANELIDQAKHYGIDEFLYEPPFGLGQVQINLFIESRSGEINHPDIAIVGLVEGVITYKTLDHTERHTKKVEYTKETYEEAVALLKQEAEALAQDVLIQEPLAFNKTCRTPVTKHRRSGHTR